MKKIGRFFLSSILLIAGVIHLVSPETFNPAIFWGHELLSNFVAGAVEIILAILLWPRPEVGGGFTALWAWVLRKE